MDKKLDKIEEKLDKISDRLGSIDSTLASQHTSLVDHIRRTELLEEDMKPIRKHVAMIQGVLKAIGILASAAVIVELIVMLIKGH